jgi:hypothetical protein
MEYRYEVWRPTDSQAVEMERVQNSVARRILGVSKNTAIVALLSELGLMPLQMRREMLAMRFYGKLVRMNNDRLVKRVFRMRKEQWSRDKQPEGSEKRKRQEKGWMPWMESLLTKYRLQEAWETENVGEKEEDWKIKVTMAVERRMKEWWEESSDGMPTLERYRNLVSGWSDVPQTYITNVGREHAAGAMQIARLRCGANSLMISQGRHTKNNEKIERDERKCKCCQLQGREAPVEDEKHFLLHCESLREAREKWMTRVGEVMGEERWQEIQNFDDDDLQVDFLLGVVGSNTNGRFGECSDELLSCILRGVNSMFVARKSLMYKDLW